MKRTSFLSAIIGFSLLLGTIGCAKEDLHVAPLPGAGGGGKTPNLTIETVKGPNTEPCGGFLWQVKFNLKKPSAKGGWIVQKVTFEQNVIKCPNAPYINKKITYWEAWRVAAGTSGDSERLAGKFNYDDQFSQPNFPDTRGSTSITGQVAFFEDLQLPASFKKNNPDTYAGGLPATTDKPDFWTEENAANHNLSYVWNCCDPGNVPVLVTTPNDPKQVLPVPGDTSRLDYTGKLIAKIPGWINGYGPTTSIQLVNITRQVQNSTSPQSLHNTLVNYENLFAGTSDYDMQMSKVYLMLRVMYQLPQQMDKANAKSFGGWTHPCVGSGSIYNMSWPVSATQTPTGLQVSVSEFTGFIGRGYNAAAELDYFNSSFPKRNL